MTFAEIEDKVREFLIEDLEIDPENIKLESRLKEDMGIDSLEVVDVVVLVDETFGIKLNASDLKSLKTFGDFCSFIEKKLN